MYTPILCIPEVYQIPHILELLHSHLEVKTFFLIIFLSNQCMISEI
jgi:hypothetical protein